MMKRFANLLAVFILSVNCISAQNLTRWVNPFIGTGAVQSSLSGNNYPGATVPFGMVQLSPDTREAPDWAQASGYDYNDSIIYGFSHTKIYFHLEFSQPIYPVSYMMAIGGMRILLSLMVQNCVDYSVSIRSGIMN